MKSYLLIIRLAFAGIFENKVRAFLTMLGIIIGVASVIAIMAVGAGAQSLITSSISKMGTNLVGVLPGASSDKGPPASALGITITTLVYDDAMAIADLPHVVGISAYSQGAAEIVYGKESKSGNFSGVTAAYPFVENHDLQRGRFFTETEEQASKRVAVLGADVAEELFPYTDPLGKRIRIGNITFAVVGILERKGSSMVSNSDGQVFIPLSAAQKMLTGTRHLGLIRVKIDREENVDNAMENIARTLRYRHNITNPDDDDFSVRSLSQAVETLESVTGGLNFFLASIAAISLIVGGIGITNVMLMTVKERTREIGLKKAIGAKASQIKNQFILEALVLTCFGGVLGILLGIGVSYLIAVLAWQMDYTWEFYISLQSVSLSFFVSILVGVVFGNYPARKAALLNPIDALRYE